MSKSDREVAQRIIRDIVAGANLRILSKIEASNLTKQMYWAVSRPVEWNALKKFHSARNCFAKLFESKEATERLPYLRSSYLKMLAHTNPLPGINWNYTVAMAWKEALLGNSDGFLSGRQNRDLQRFFSKTFIYIPQNGRSREREKRGDVGGVRLFTWQGLLWAFKPEENECKLSKANDSGIPKTNARMHNRSVASCLLASVLGLERIIVKTEFSYYQGKRGLEAGILMAGATGGEPQKMLPDLRVLHALSQDSRDIGAIRQNFTYAIKPHQRRDLNISMLVKLPVATDFYAANWLDYIAAQMDRHLNNIYVDFSRGGSYEGIKLIDNDMAFGTVTDPARLREIHGSQNCGLPDCIPPGLKEKILRVVQCVPNPAGFWDRCQTGDPMAPSAPPFHDAPRAPGPASAPVSRSDGLPPRQNLLLVRGHHGPAPRQPPVDPSHTIPVEDDFQLVDTSAQEPDAFACMAEIARLLSRDEFGSLMRRMNLAAQRADIALPLTSGTVAMMAREYTTVAARAASDQGSEEDTRKKTSLDDRSYWHRLLCVYAAGSGVKVEYDNPPKSAEEWVQGGRKSQ
ncbi:MAG: hypothetical protein ABFD98_09505 [Syntrophobacteraceae bacterium]|nr:hypothetical protein [Desulfobacteraceae bacterium]